MIYLQVVVQIRKVIGRNLYVSIDEAQLLLSTCVDLFEGPNSHSPHALLTPFVKMLSSFTPLTLLVSGTGLRLQQSLEVVASAVFKPEQDMRKFLIVNWGGYTQQQKMGYYLRAFFPITNEELTKVYEMLKGLYR